MQSVGFLLLAFYIVLSLSTISFVRYAGPIAIGSNYQIEERCGDNDSGRLNIAYRILAPTICCGVPVLVLVAICDAVSIPIPTLRILPAAFYWVFLAVIKHARHALKNYIVPFTAEALISILLSIAFDNFVIEGYINGLGIGVLDSSSIAFQFELAVFGVATCWISTSFTRAWVKCYRLNLTSEQGGDLKYGSIIDTSESRLFSYERKYGDLLPHRFERDILLRSVFFAIMAIEDGNRPTFVRSVERIAARLNLAKTTGIMQQRGCRPLSDEESVILAIPFVEEIWDRYLSEFARSSEGVGGGPFRIHSKYYEYDYFAMASSITSNFGLLYGDYCGTRLLNASGVFVEVLEFERRQRFGLLPKVISAPGQICAIESEWVSGEYCFWSDHDTIVSCLLDSNDDAIQLKSTQGIDEGTLTRITMRLRSLGAIVLSVKLINGAFASIMCLGDESVVLGAIDDNWTVLDWCHREGAMS